MAPPPFMTTGSVVLGRYQIVGLLGEGGMGSVFEVLDLALRRRRCALKVLQASLIGNATVRERFMREAEFAAGLDDEHVVRVFDRGELAPAVPFYTMELLRGRSLATVARSEPSMPWRRARHIGIQLCQVLALVHAQKIVHRDLKPDNCFLVSLSGDPDFLKLLDFGLARADDGDPRLTMGQEQVGGTALYMSPEHVRGDEVDHRTDIWAVGVILHELLTGRNPFERANLWQVYEAIRSDSPPPPPSYFDPKLPPAVDALIARAMHKELPLRFQSADEMRAALEAIPPDAEVASPVAPEPRSPPARVHTPTALAMTQAAEQANAQFDRVAAPPRAPPSIAPSVPTPAAVPKDPTSLAAFATPADDPRAAPMPVPRAPQGRRRLALVLGGSTVLLAALAVAAATWTQAPPPEPAAAAPSPEPAPVNPPVREDRPPPTDLRDPVTVRTEPVNAGDTPAPLVEPGAPPATTPEKKRSSAKTMTKKPPATSGPMTQTGLDDAVKAWKAAVRKAPPKACPKSTLPVEFAFKVEATPEGLKLSGAEPAGWKSCADDLKKLFAARHRGRSLGPGVRASVTLTLGD